MIAVIVACEVGFWVAVLGGLALRYVARLPRAGLLLLALAPVIDLVLLVVTAVDVRAGGTATWAHGLAAVYIGFSVAYGRRMIAWADARFARWRTGRALPARPVGWAYTRRCWTDVLLTGIAVVIAGGILGGLVAWAGDGAQTEALVAWLPILGIVLAVELVWAVSTVVWPRRTA